jgi:hypothetical protein
VEEGAEPVEEEANANMEVDDVDARCRGWRGHHGELVWTMEEPVTVKSRIVLQLPWKFYRWTT